MPGFEEYYLFMNSDGFLQILKYAPKIGNIKDVFSRASMQIKRLEQMS